MNQPHPNDRPSPEWSPAELTQATDRHAHPSNLPPAVQPLQAGFLAFGCATQRAAPVVNSAALLARIRERLDEASPPSAAKCSSTECAAAGLPSSAVPQSAPAQQALGRLLLALAASLLVGMTLLGNLRTPPSSPQVARQVPQSVNPAVAPAAQPQPAASADGVAGVAEESQLAWDDLDDEINAAATAIQQLRWGSAGVDSSLEGFQQRLLEMNAEVSSTSL